MMAKVIVFEANGEVKLATLVDPEKMLCRENLKDFVPCPKEVLDCVPEVIAEFCKESAPHYLYRTETGWESTQDPIPV